MKTLFNKITKLAIIPVLAGSLALEGCYKEYKEYNFDGEIIKYNRNLAEPLKVITDDSVFVYSSYRNKDSINAVYVYPRSNINRGVNYLKHGKNKEKFNEYQKKYTAYLNKISKQK
ncbi:hypothetical protein HYS72_00630 [Candidatus Pacearchaeota archaeon]|nr:hypothetical protein [Candidatus Pacearchaeota archaeon]